MSNPSLAAFLLVATLCAAAWVVSKARSTERFGVSAPPPGKMEPKAEEGPDTTRAQGPAASPAPRPRPPGAFCGGCRRR